MKTPSPLTAIPSEIAARLAVLAPSIAFSVSREIDENYRWDGHSEDPTENGSDAYFVTVTAHAILDGRMAGGASIMGGFYFLPDEPTGELNGYLLQMLKDAAEDLQYTLTLRGGHTVEKLEQVADAQCYIRQAMRASCDAQRAGKA
jgi:hypothetical protein